MLGGPLPIANVLTYMYTILYHCSILVDDGTSVAMVTLCGDMMKDLLLLTGEQWKAIQTETSKAGEIFVQLVRILVL